MSEKKNTFSPNALSVAAIAISSLAIGAVGATLLSGHQQNPPPGQYKNHFSKHHEGSQSSSLASNEAEVPSGTKLYHRSSATGHSPQPQAHSSSPQPERKSQASVHEPSPTPPSKSKKQSVEDNASQASIDLSKLRVASTRIIYGNQAIPKIGYDANGQRVSPEVKKEQIQKFVSRIVEQGDKFAFKFPAYGEERKSVVVFTDPTCPYCQKVHKQLEEVRRNGVTVYYMMFPRALTQGLYNTGALPIVEALKTAWCSKDPAEGINRVYLERATGAKTPLAEGCSIPQEQGRVAFPYAEHYFMASIAGVDATPITFTSDGNKVIGSGNYLKRIAGGY